MWKEGETIQFTKLWRKVPRGRIISIKNITNDELEVIKEEQPKKKVDDELEIKEEPKTIEVSSSEE